MKPGDRSPQLRDIDKNQFIDNPTSKPIEKASAKTASTSKRQKEKDAEDYEPIHPKKACDSSLIKYFLFVLILKHSI